MDIDGALARCEAWIFDLDGTLTHAVHDFRQIADELGLSHEQPILESLAQMPAGEAAAIHQRLAQIEHELTQRTRVQDGVCVLLQSLQDRGCRLGILTRNTRSNAIATLHGVGLADYFHQTDIVGREECAPKPSPEGIHMLLSIWRKQAESAVMIGDYRFDLMAGRAASVRTVLFDPSAGYEWSDLTDHCFSDYQTLHRLAHP